MENKIRKIKGGYTLVEMLFYIALFSVLSLAIIASLISMTKAFRVTTAQADLVQSSAVMERISREIRQAYEIISISANDLKLIENNVFTGDLNSSNIQITALSFTEITTPAGKAVKASLSVKSVRDATGRIENFYNTVVLRGDY